MKVAIYTRVSTAEQNLNGFSIHEQRKKLISFCEINEWKEYEVFTDGGFSGGSTKRPALQDLFNRLTQFDLVLVYKLDRLTRNVRDLLEMLERFEKYNVSFKSATEVFDTTTAIGKLFITIVGAMAEWERETIRERSLFGSRAAVESGKYIREQPFVYDNIEGKYKAEYRQGYWNSIDRTNDADDIAEFETEFGVYLKKKRGWATLPEQIEKNKAAYGFHDTVAADPANDGLASEDIPQPNQPSTVESV